MNFFILRKKALVLLSKLRLSRYNSPVSTAEREGKLPSGQQFFIIHGSMLAPSKKMPTPSCQVFLV